MKKCHRQSILWSLLVASAACSSGRTEGGESVYVAPGEMDGPADTPSVTTGDDNTEGNPSEPTSPTADNEAAPSNLPIVGSGEPDGTETPAAGAPAQPSEEMPADMGAEMPVDMPEPEEERIVLFDGTNLDAWVSRNTGGPVGWQVVGDGSVVVTPGTGDIITREEFEDVFVHAEYKTPMLPANVQGQDRGNSGIYLKGMYEVQVLDSFGRQPEIDGCGSIYGVAAPLTVSCFQEEVWNTYEIEFQAPRYNDQGNKVSNALMVLVTLNGVVVQRNTEVPGGTRAGFAESPGPAGIMLQDHGNRLWFRNIYVIPR